MEKDRNGIPEADGGPDREALQEALGYRFRERALLDEALTHRSWANEHPGSTGIDNERLEFLGDAVLGLAAADYLSDSLPSATEGELTKIRSSLVDETFLAGVARRIGLGLHLRLGRGEDCSGGREKPSILSGSLEALVGAVFLDAGWERARDFVRSLFPAPNLLDNAPSDAKTRLQELCQDRFRDTPRYSLVEKSGPAHRPVFTAAVHLGDRCLGQGGGCSKKAAEQAAAEGALDELEKQ